MKARILMTVCFILSVAVVGCDKTSSAAEDKDEARAEAPADKAEDEGGEAEEGEPEDEEEADEEDPAEKVEVAKGGTEFDPAVEPEQLPDGAWYCDMGTVHWAGMDKPDDGKCPVCGMKLKQFDPETRAEHEDSAVEAGGDHGHAHEGDEGDHSHDDEHGHHDDHGHDDHGHQH